MMVPTTQAMMANEANSQTNFGSVLTAVEGEVECRGKGILELRESHDDGLHALRSLKPNCSQNLVFCRGGKHPLV
jgi:hypothetical protein